MIKHNLVRGLYKDIEILKNKNLKLNKCFNELVNTHQRTVHMYNELDSFTNKAFKQGMVLGAIIGTCGTGALILLLT